MPTISQGATLGDVVQIIHAATLLGPAAWGREPMPESYMAAGIEDRLKRQLVELFKILVDRKIPCVLVGGIAMLTYVGGRNTQDVDLILAVESLTELPEIVILDRNRDFARAKLGDLTVDLRFTTHPLFQLVAEKFTTVHRFLETDVTTATIEGLILLKLFALPSLYRQRRGERIGLYENDIFTLCLRASPQMEPLLAILANYVDPPAIEDLKTILAEIQQRISRVRNAGGDKG